MTKDRQIEKELRHLLKTLSGGKAASNAMEADILEFIAAREWGLALDHLEDWAAADKKTKVLEKNFKTLRRQMQA